MNYLRLIFLLVSPLLATSCSTTSGGASQAAQIAQTNQNQLAANSFKPQAGMAGLYIFEEGSLIRADNSHRVFLDGQALGMVSSSSYLYSPLAPGKHTVSCESSQVSLDVQAGQNYFVREKTHLDPSGQILNTTLSIESSSVAIPLIKELQTME